MNDGEPAQPAVIDRNALPFDASRILGRGARRGVIPPPICTPRCDIPALSDWRPFIVRRDFREQAIAPDREQLTLEDGAAHGSGAVRHRGIHQPFLAELTEALGLFQAALLALLLDRR
jgi:hypothetical protein